MEPDHTPPVWHVSLPLPSEGTVSWVLGHETVKACPTIRLPPPGGVAALSIPEFRQVGAGQVASCPHTWVPSLAPQVSFWVQDAGRHLMPPGVVVDVSHVSGAVQVLDRVFQTAREP